MGSTDVLILNAGPWFNLKKNDESALDFTGALCMLSFLNTLSRSSHPSAASELRRRISEGVDICEGVRSSCSEYSCDWGRSEFAFVRVVVNLAEFVVQYRARLPRLVVWLEGGPQHFPGTG